jgi:hypothetical protein
MVSVLSQSKLGLGEYVRDPEEVAPAQELESVLPVEYLATLVPYLLAGTKEMNSGAIICTEYQTVPIGTNTICADEDVAVNLHSKLDG